MDLLASQKTIKVQTQKADAGNTFLALSKAESEAVALPAPEDRAGGARTRNLVVELRARLQLEAPEFASLVTVTNAPPNVIQALLQPDEALLEYYYTGQDLVVFIMTRDAIKAVKLERAGLEDSVMAFRKSLADPVSRDYLGQAQ